MSTSTNRKIIIDPRSSYAYGSFYLYGLIRLFGEANVRFSMKPFRELPDVGWNFRFIAVSQDIVVKTVAFDSLFPEKVECLRFQILNCNIRHWYAIPMLALFAQKKLIHRNQRQKPQREEISGVRTELDPFWFPQPRIRLSC